MSRCNLPNRVCNRNSSAVGRSRTLQTTICHARSADPISIHLDASSKFSQMLNAPKIDDNKLSFSDTENVPAMAKYAPPSSIIVPEKQFPRPSLSGKNLMRLLTEEEIRRRPPEREILFRKNKDGVRVGDVLLVESFTHQGSESTTSFAGICISIRRQGVDTNFTLRNIISKVGVEIRYSLFSPMIKDIKILQKGEGFRRAKLFYLRNQPEKAFQSGGLLKKELNKKAETQTGKK
ncbi:1717_t:CDS:2 [Acaulospora morrowiae]|uniref:1717_t:CDS:1 n=1 Tax=Acaulospora morrowiae TaxID=94023 RepID=A0A9N8UZH7_9GLOM|nr:1717_t:CDS:2 [Acaulospora morrowiae]